jgi:hypothetical protein
MSQGSERVLRRKKEPANIPLDSAMRRRCGNKKPGPVKGLRQFFATVRLYFIVVPVLRGTQARIRNQNR